MTIAFNYIENWQDVIDYMLAKYPEEGCGYVTKDNQFVPMENLAEDKINCFDMNSSILIEVPDIKAIIHSHTYDPNKPPEVDPRTPSKADMQGQIDTNVEWGIVVTEGENVVIPFWFGDKSHRPPLMEREFIHSTQDCFAFMADWMYKEYKVDIPTIPREYDWFLKGENYFDNQYQEWEFEDVTNEKRIRGDVVFYRIRSDVVNHIGVMVDENTVVHHLFGRLPVKEPYEIWAKYVTRKVRLTEEGKNKYGTSNLSPR